MCTVLPMKNIQYLKLLHKSFCNFSLMKLRHKKKIFCSGFENYNNADFDTFCRYSLQTFKTFCDPVLAVFWAD